MCNSIRFWLLAISIWLHPFPVLSEFLIETSSTLKLTELHPSCQSSNNYLITQQFHLFVFTCSLFIDCFEIDNESILIQSNRVSPVFFCFRFKLLLLLVIAIEWFIDREFLICAVMDHPSSWNGTRASALSTIANVRATIKRWTINTGFIQ